uniref:Uncharacterized protein n=1 Tax=Meloidogyne enterolobii TaxID=390850 RepID=A0A6V7VQE9_MELEN|nr:unnamed protein product [Meloidogyne enterolobii]
MKFFILFLFGNILINLGQQEEGNYDKTDVQILREEDPLAIALRFDININILYDWLKYCYIKSFEAKKDEAKSAVDILVYIKSFDNFFEENKNIIPNLLINWINIRSLIFLFIENLQEEQPDKSLNIKLINLFKNIIYKIKIFIEGKGGKIIGSKKENNLKNLEINEKEWDLFGLLKEEINILEKEKFDEISIPLLPELNNEKEKEELRLLFEIYLRKLAEASKEFKERISKTKFDFDALDRKYKVINDNNKNEKENEEEEEEKIMKSEIEKVIMSMYPSPSSMLTYFECPPTNEDKSESSLGVDKITDDDNEDLIQACQKFLQIKNRIEENRAYDEALEKLNMEVLLWNFKIIKAINNNQINNFELNNLLKRSKEDTLKELKEKVCKCLLVIYKTASKYKHEGLKVN